MVRIPPATEFADAALKFPDTCDYFVRNNHVFVTRELLDAHGAGHRVRACALDVASSARDHRSGRITRTTTHTQFCMTYARWLVFPKAFPLPELPAAPTLASTTGAALPPAVRFVGELRASRSQDTAVKACVTQMVQTPHGGAVLTLPPGAGKTSCALCIAACLGRRTFWLTHTDVLAQQAAARAAQFLPAARVLLFSSRSTVADVDACDVAVGLMQTVYQLADVAPLQTFGLLVVDEAHHICAAQLRKCLPRFNTRYTLGLTATPERRDGLTDLLYWALGPSAYCERPDYTHMGASVATLHYACTDPAWRSANPLAAARSAHVVDHKTTVTLRCARTGRVVKRGGITSADELRQVDAGALREHTTHTPVMSPAWELAEAGVATGHVGADPARNALIVRDVVRRVRADGRKVLVLTDRRCHALVLRDMLVAAGLRTVLQLGGPRRDPFDASLAGRDAVDALVASYQLVSEGFDVPWLDTVWFAVPKDDIVQSAGRGLRECALKQPPLLVDLVDSGCASAARKHRARQRQFRAMGLV